MGFPKLLAATLALYALLNFRVIPRLTTAWKANRSLTKSSKAGVLSTLEFLRDTTLVVGIVYLAFAAFTMVLALGVGHNAGVLGWAVGSAASLHEALTRFKRLWDHGVLVLTLGLFVVISVRYRRREFADRFSRTVDTELDRLNELRGERPEEWDSLEPDNRMRAIDGQIVQAEAELAALPPADRQTPLNRQRLLRRIAVLREQRSEADYGRRVNLEGDAAPTPEPQTWRSVLRSKGVFSDIKGVGTLMSHASVALLAIAMIGVASRVGLADELWRRLVRLDDLRVEAAKPTTEAVAARWKGAGTKPLTEDDREAVAHLTDAFARALVQNPHWRASGAAVRQGSDARRSIVRRAILNEVVLPDEIGQPALAFHDDASAAERAVVRDVAGARAAGDTRIGRILAEREGPTVKAWFGDRWESVKSTMAARYREPLMARDLESALLDRVISAGFDGLVPEPDNEIVGQMRDAMSDGVKKSVNQATTTAFHEMVEDMASGRSYEQAIDKVRTRNIPFSKGHAEQLATLMVRERMPDAEAVANRLASSGGHWRPPEGSSGDDSYRPTDPPTPSGGGSGGGSAGARTGAAASEGGGRPPGNPSTNVNAEVDATVDAVAREHTGNGRYSLAEEHVDGLAQYEDYFPRSVESQRATPLGKALTKYRVPADAEAFGRLARLKVARAGNFSMLRGFSRVGGVLIGIDPQNAKTVIPMKNIDWHIAGRAVTLTLTDPSGKRRDFGPYDKSLVHQALAYAADGRPVAVTMTKARPLTQLKIHLHPSLVDTPLGCRVAQLDRLVDTYTFDLAGRDALTTKYRNQLDVYNFAWALRLKALANTFNEQQVTEMADVRRQRLRQTAITALSDPTIFDSEGLFTRKEEFFDPAVVKAARACAARGADAFEACVIQDFASKRALKNKDMDALRRWFEGEADFDPWSGVREQPFQLTGDLAFLRPPAGSAPGHRLWPFDFIVQIAFTSPPVNVSGSEQEYVDQQPVEFDAIHGQILALVAAGIPRDGFASQFDELKSFAILQRLFRVALAGSFGNRFPLERLGRLAGETSNAVPYAHTNRWNGSLTLRFESLLRLGIANDVSASWMRRAADQAVGCRAALRRGSATNLDSACDFAGISEPAKHLCESVPRASRTANNPRCVWAAVANQSSDIAEAYRMEQTFGVLDDAAKSTSSDQCASLTGPATRPIADRRGTP